MKKIIILILLFYFLVLFQTSLLVHFTIFGMVPNIVLILIFLLNLFEKSKSSFGFYSALIGGFFLDIFSNRFIGFYILISLALAIFLKIIIRKHVRIPFIETT